jgi:DUF4097 and DUF4098 domain-containing protein YvlB
MNKKMLVCSLLLALAPAAFAATPIKPAAKPLDATGTVEISNIRGSIKVTGWDRKMVAVTGSLGEDTRLVFEGSGSRMQVRAERISERKGWFGWNGSGPREDSLIQVHVPQGASLEIESVSADVEVAGISGSDRLQLESVSGDAELQAKTISLTLSTVSGDVQFAGRAERATSESVSGDVTLRDVEGELKVETVSGDTRISHSRLRRIDGGSVSGDLDFDIDLVDNASVDVESMSGTVTLRLPAGLSATVNAETFSGSLTSDFGLKIIDEQGPGSEMHGKIGNGDARIELESFSGDIRVRRR